MNRPGNWPVPHRSEGVVDMKLDQKIQLERLERAEQLSRTEQAELLADSEAQALLKENAGLAGVRLAGHDEPAPPRRAVLNRVLAVAGNRRNPMEHTMSTISRIFADKPWYARAGLAAALVAALATLALLLPTDGKSPAAPAWAATDGYLLHFDMGTVPISDDGVSQQDPELEARINEVLTAIQEFGEANPQDDDPQSVHVKVMVKEGNAIVEVSLLNADKARLEEIQAFLADNPGLPVPSVIPATWYGDDEKKLTGEDQLTISLQEHAFSFPSGATAEEMEAAINAWLAEEFPGMNMRAVVTIDETAEGLQRITINSLQAGEEPAEK